MSVLPQLSGRRLVRALQQAGFLILRQHGSHVIMRHATDPSRRVVVPVHGARPIKPGTLHAILRGADLAPEALKDLL